MAPAKSIIFCVKHLEMDVRQPQGNILIYSLAADLIVRPCFIVQKGPGDSRQRCACTHSHQRTPVFKWLFFTAPLPLSLQSRQSTHMIQTDQNGNNHISYFIATNVNQNFIYVLIGITLLFAQSCFKQGQDLLLYSLNFLSVCFISGILSFKRFKKVTASLHISMPSAAQQFALFSFPVQLQKGWPLMESKQEGPSGRLPARLMIVVSFSLSVCPYCLLHSRNIFLPFL